MKRCANELLERCSQGDSWAWRDLVSRYRPAILRVLVRASLAGDVTEVCDLEQEVWARVLQRKTLRRLRCEDDASLKAFLCTVALNIARDAHRRAGIRFDPRVFVGGYDETLDPPNGDPELRAANRECHRQVIDAAREEVRDERDLLIFQLYFRSGASASEIADVPGVGLSAKGVETVLYRLVQRLRRRLGTDG